MPWFSPILGSGCLDLGEGPDLRPKALQGVRATVDWAVAALPTIDSTPADLAADLDSTVERFVKSLTKARAPDMAVHRSEGSGGGAGTQIVIVAALATRAFHAASSRTCQPIGDRFRANAVPLPSRVLKNSEGHLRDVARVLLEQLSQPAQLEELGKHWKGERFWRDLVDHLLRQLDRPGPSGLPHQGELSGFDVQLLTECAWLMIVHDSSLYPGWSDLLVGLMGAPPQADRVRGIRQTPTQIDANIAKEVRDLLEPVTKKSWKARLSGAEDDTPREDRRTFYAQVALLLNKQAQMRQLLWPFEPRLDDSADDYLLRDDENTKSQSDAMELRRRLTNEAASREAGFHHESWSAPSAVAVVTSFDIELEMALWSLEHPFVVVLPMLVANQTQRSQPARVVWLAAKFDPASDVIDVDFPAGTATESEVEQHERSLRVLREAPRSWFPAEEVRNRGALAACTNLPTIVRLSGSPLIRVEADDIDPSYVKSLGTADTFEFLHALTIDEYSSLRLSAHEVFSLTSRGGLPAGLPWKLLVGTDTMPRVWVSFGVQVDDPASRMRLFNQLSVAAVAPSLDDSSRQQGSSDARPVSGTSPMAATAGLAINRRFNDADAAVMRWLGFEFAEVDVSTVIDRVRHYVEDHLEWALQQLTGNDLLSWPTELERTSADSRRVSWRRAEVDRCDFLGNNRQ
jgi:hypothetical protein